MRRLILSAFAAILAGTAPAATNLNLREFKIQNDVAFDSNHRAIEWYQGESVRYELMLKRQNAWVQIPSDTEPVWKIWQTTPATSLYAIKTGTVVNASRGQVRVDLTPSEANLPTGAYFSALQLWDGTDYMGLAGKSDLTIFYSPAGDDINYVGTSPSFGIARASERFAVHDADTDAAVQLSATGGLPQVQWRDTNSAVFSLSVVDGLPTWITGASGDILNTNGFMLGPEADPSAVLADGTRAMTGDLDLGGNSITNVGTNSLRFIDGTAFPQDFNADVAALVTTSNALRLDITSNYATLEGFVNAASNANHTLTTSQIANVQASIDAASNGLNTAITDNLAANSAEIAAASNALTTVDASTIADVNAASNALATDIAANLAMLNTASNWAGSIMSGNGAGVTSAWAMVATASNALQSRADAAYTEATNAAQDAVNVSNALITLIQGNGDTATNNRTALNTASNALNTDIVANLAAIDANSNTFHTATTNNRAATTAASNSINTTLGGLGDLVTNNTTLIGGNGVVITQTISALNTASNALRTDVTANAAGIAAASNALNTAITDHTSADADLAATNELNQTLALNTNQLDLTDPGGTLSADLSGYDDGAEIAAASNALNTAISANATSITSVISDLNTASNALNTAIGVNTASINTNAYALGVASNSLRVGINDNVGRINTASNAFTSTINNYMPVAGGTFFGNVALSTNIFLAWDNDTEGRIINPRQITNKTDLTITAGGIILSSGAGSNIVIQTSSNIQLEADTVISGILSADGSLVSNLNYLALSGGTVTGSVTANAFVGDGAGLTNLNYLDLSGGTVTGAVTADSFTGDGSGLTNIQVTSLFLADGEAFISSNNFTAPSGVSIITGLTAGTAQNLTIDGTSVLISVEGTYQMQFHASFRSADPSETSIFVFSNSVAGGRTHLKTCGFFRSFAGGASERWGVGGASCQAHLITNDWLTVEMWSDAAEDLEFAPLTLDVTEVSN